MKLIDDRGKILGLINIVDLIILLVVLLVAAGAAYKYTHKSVETKSVTVEFKVLLPHLRPELIGSIKVGDKMVQGSNFTDVKVKDIQVQPGYSINVDSRGQRVESYDPYLKDVYVTNTGTTVLSSAIIVMGGQEIRVGKEYFFKSREYEFRGTVVKVDIKE